MIGTCDTPDCTAEDDLSLGTFDVLSVTGVKLVAQVGWLCSGCYNERYGGDC